MTMSGVRSLCSAGEAAGGVASGTGLRAAGRAAARAFITEVASACTQVTCGVSTLLLGASCHCMLWNTLSAVSELQTRA